MSLFSCRDPDELISYDEMYEAYSREYAEHKAKRGRRTRGTGFTEDPALVAQRWNDLGLNADPRLRQFAESSEWVSLGCFCAPTRALEFLDLRKKAYPLEWARSDTQGVIHLLNNNFADFFERAGPPRPGAVATEKSFPTTWGGCFWHSDLDNPKDVSDLKRRIDRLYGKDPSIPPEKRRVFVHCINGSNDLPLEHELHGALQRIFHQSDVHLLTLVDGQPAEEIVKLQKTKHSKVLFYKVPVDIWTAGSFKGFTTLAEAYTHGIARAIRVWTGTETPTEMVDLRHLSSSISPFYGNNPTFELYQIKEGEPNLDRYLQQTKPGVEHALEKEEELEEKEEELEDEEDKGRCREMVENLQDNCVVS